MRMKVKNDYRYDGQIIALSIGDTVRIEKKSDPNGTSPNWVFCTSDKTGKSGWVAEGILTVNGNIASVNENYTSEEMTVSAGDIVDTVYELNGWFWCRRVSDSKEAWIEKINLESI